jgi:hypothetical protein
MIRLLYLSQATNTLSNEKLQEILESSGRNNPALGITGLLLTGGGVFMQVLEGPELAVLQLYVKILLDRRHGDCEIICVSPVNERMFDKWSMGLVDSAPLEFQEIKELRDKRFESVPAKTYTEIMGSLLKTLNAGKRPVDIGNIALPVADV